MTRKILAFPIPGLRNDNFFAATYSTFEVPDIKDIFTLNGDWGWTGITVVLKETQWETFKANPELWDICRSPTACYVEIDEEPDENGKNKQCRMSIFYGNK